MWTPCSILIFAILTASSQGYVLNERDEHITGEEHLGELQVMEEDRMDSTMQQNESTLANVGGTIDETYESSRNSRTSDGDLTTILLDVYLANFDNIKTLKITILKILATNIRFLMEEVEKSDVTSALDLPIVDFIMEMLMPLLSGNNGLGNEFGLKNNLISDSLNIGANFLHDKSETPANDVIPTEKSASMDMDPLFEESSSTIATQSSVRKFLAL